MPKKKRVRRTDEQLIADLKAEIDRIKARAAEKSARRDPALRHVSAAIRSIDRAAAAARDATTRKALSEARATLGACLALHGVELSIKGARAGRARHAAPGPEHVLAYIRDHAGSRSEEICGKLGTNAASLRRVLHRLRDDGKVEVEGKGRATTYSAVE